MSVVKPRIIEECSGVRLEIHQHGPCGAYPMRPFAVVLPSGMTHHFESQAKARASQYWPGMSGPCVRCGEAEGKLVRDTATGRVYCDWCAAELNRICWGES
jgi:hypothetical protein